MRNNHGASLTRQVANAVKWGAKRLSPFLKKIVVNSAKSRHRFF
jgi:hypothetical protein